jgi:hypothetical protein
MKKGRTKKSRQNIDENVLNESKDFSPAEMMTLEHVA